MSPDAEPNGFITDPSKIFEIPFLIMERVGAFVLLIFEQAWAFATEIAKISV